MVMSRSTDSGVSRIAVQESARSERGNGAGHWRQSKWLWVGELAVVGLIFWADFRHLIVFSKTPYLVLFGWISLWVRKLRWRDVGVSRFRNWTTTLGWGIAAGLGLEGFELFVSQPILVRLLRKQPDLEDFRQLIGHLTLTLIFIALAWVFAVFGQ